MKKKILPKMIPINAPQILDNKTSRKEVAPLLTFAEYFAGIGLVRLGLERAGWKICFANDFSTEKFDMYATYFNDAEEHYVVKDVFDILPQNVPKTLLATASFPCIDLSLAGNLSGINGKHSSAFWGFINIIKHREQKPKLILLENVTGWLSSNEGTDFRLTIEALNQLGYACDVYTIDAAHFVPQSRPRVFVVGVQATPNQDIFKLLRRSDSVASKGLKKAVSANIDLKWYTIDIPNLPIKNTTKLNDIIEQLANDDSRWWHYDEVKRHLNMMSSANLDYLEKFKSLPEYTYRTMYRRMRNGMQRAEVRKDNIAGCLRTARGGSSRQMLVKAGQGKIAMRLMTPREYARLQGVPDDYPIPEQINQALTGFGDAVCVPVITWIAENVLNLLALTFIDAQADHRESQEVILRAS